MHAAFTLNQFQTLNLEAVSDGDLTGTVLSADKPFGVFVGHEATVLSNQPTSPCCADHLEDQLFPSSTWGKVYAVAKTAARSTPVPDMIRVIAQNPGTTVIGSGTYKAGRIAVNAGQHKIDCAETCGVEVYGFSPAVSYMFAGGLDLEQIVVE